MVSVVLAPRDRRGVPEAIMPVRARSLCAVVHTRAHKKSGRPGGRPDGSSIGTDQAAGAASAAAWPVSAGRRVSTVLTRLSTGLRPVGKPASPRIALIIGAPHW